MSRYSSRISLSDRLADAKSEIENGQAKFADIVRNVQYIQDEAKKTEDWAMPQAVRTVLQEIAAAAKDIEDAIGGNLLMTNNRVVNNVRKVLEARDIGLLRPETYRFITLHMGFIAHYDLGGFKAEYTDLRRLCRNLQTSEYSDGLGNNIAFSVRLHDEGKFEDADTIHELVLLAREYQEQIGVVFTAYERDREVEQARTLAEKHGYVLVRQWNPEPARARS